MGGGLGPTPTSSAAGTGGGSARRPNFLIVVLDDVRFDDFAFCGHPFVRTPNFDRIAREGIHFLNAFTPVPLCSPNRASLLTGLYAHSHGITDNTDRGAESHLLPTYPDILQRAGYETSFIGKWHMGLDDSPRPGFDDWLCLRGQGDYFDPEVNDNGRQRRLDGYASDIFSDRAAAFIRRGETVRFWHTSPTKRFTRICFKTPTARSTSCRRTAGSPLRRGSQDYTRASPSPDARTQPGMERTS